jgi:hypothetical protein
MTAPTYDTLTSDDTGADKILTTGTMTALDQNPIAVAQRGTSAPVPQVPVVAKLTASSGNWTWPDGVTAATFYIQAPGGGGGGSSGGSNGGDGTDSTITYNSITTTAEGGDGGTKEGTTFAGEGGNAGGGDFSVYGGTAGAQIGAASYFGVGGTHVPSVSPHQGGGGRGDSSGGQGGGGGEMVRKRLVKVDGLNTVAYVNGAVGTSGGGSAQAGGAGVILVEY